MSTEIHTPILPALTDRTALATFGARFKARLPLQAGAVVNVLDNRQIEGLPGAVSVHLFRPDRTVDAEGGGADVHAKITYSNGAISSVVYCDWDGQFSLVCSSIAIDLQTYAPLLNYYSPAREQIFGALIGLGACSPAGESIGFTSGLIAAAFNNGVDGSGTHLFALPDFARRWWPMFNVPLTEIDLMGITVGFGTTASGGVMSQDLTRDILLHGLPVPGGVRFVNVTVTGITSIGLVHYFRLGL